MNLEINIKKPKDLNLSRKVYEVVKTIPQGEMWTYKRVALRVGHPGAYRAVGTILSKNTDPQVPCHRVVRSDGKIGKYNGIRGEKEKLLRLEGAIK